VLVDRVAFKSAPFKTGGSATRKFNGVRSVMRKGGPPAGQNYGLLAFSAYHFPE